MNTAKEYLLRDAVEATPEQHPQLCRIFNEMKLRHNCDHELSLMVGTTYSSGVAVKLSPSSGVVLLDEDDIMDMTPDVIEFLIAHEVAHFSVLHTFDAVIMPTVEALSRTPMPLARLMARICNEILADIAAVSECRNVDAAVEFLSGGDDELKALYVDLFFSRDNQVPEKLYYCFESAIRLQALGLLMNSEYYFGLLETGVSAQRGQALSNHWNRVDKLFSHYLDFSEADASALGAVMGAGLYIAGCRCDDQRWHNEIEALGDYGAPEQLFDFKTVQTAYDTIEINSQHIRGIRHPLKNIAYDVVAGAVWSREDDADVADEFLGSLADRIGLDAGEMLSL